MTDAELDAMTPQQVEDYERGLQNEVQRHYTDGAIAFGAGDLAGVWAHTKASRELIREWGSLLEWQLEQIAGMMSACDTSDADG